MRNAFRRIVRALKYIGYFNKLKFCINISSFYYLKFINRKFIQSLLIKIKIINKLYVFLHLSFFK